MRPYWSLNIIFFIRFALKQSGRWVIWYTMESD
nr:MAG TPA: hypothetical protein [Caudoviricetes sp.]